MRIYVAATIFDCQWGVKEAFDGTKTQRLYETSLHGATYLVQYLGGCIGQSDVLLKSVADFLQFLALRPVVESACHIDLGSGVTPTEKSSDERLVSYGHICNCEAEA